MKFLLDTNIISELRKKRPDASVLTWFDSVSGSDLYLSVLVLGEIRQGIERLKSREPKRVASYEKWLDELRHEFADRVLPISDAVALEWGRMVGRSPGIPAIDGLLAATAKNHGLTLVTRNVVDVARTGVALLNPFDAGAPGR